MIPTAPFAIDGELRVALVKCSNAGEHDRRNWPIAPPLGIMYLSACLKQNLHHPVQTRLLTLDDTPEDHARLGHILTEFRPHLLGFSAVTAESHTAEVLARMAKKVLPGVLTAIGGPHATVYPDCVEGNPHFDMAVSGEGENAIVDIARAIISGRGFEDIRGLSFVDHNGILCHNPPAEPIADLDSLPFPDWEAIDIEAYQNRKNIVGYHNPNDRYMSLVTSRGCPYRCIYCHNLFGKKTRFRSAENVMQEILHLHRNYNINEFIIFDDIFNLDHDRMMRLMDLIIDEHKLDIRMAFPNGLRADIFTKEELDRMYRAGVFYMAVALEVGSPRVQKLIKKNLNMDRALENIEYASNKGIIICSFFMIGFPTETAEEMRQTLELAQKEFIDLSVIFEVTPQHGTELRRMTAELHGSLEHLDHRGYGYHSTSANFSAAGDADFEKIKAQARRITDNPHTRQASKDKLDHWGLTPSYIPPPPGSALPRTAGRRDKKQAADIRLRKSLGPHVEKMARAVAAVNAKSDAYTLHAEEMRPAGLEITCTYRDQEECLALLPKSVGGPAFGRSNHFTVVRRTASPGGDDNPLLKLLIGIVQRIDGPFAKDRTTTGS